MVVLARNFHNALQNLEGKNLFSIYVSHHSISPQPTEHSPSLQSVTLSTPRYYSIYSRQRFDLTQCFKNHIFTYLQNCKINESPCVDVKCEEASTSASAIKMSTAEVKQGGCKLPRQWLFERNQNSFPNPASFTFTILNLLCIFYFRLCNIFHLFKKSISTMYLTRGWLFFTF